MSSPYTLKITAEQAKEMPMVDLAFEVLKASNTPYYYRDLMQEIAKLKDLSDDGVMQVIAQLYTEINIDGRFACVGTNLWGLKRWYPVDKSEDGVSNSKHPRIINDDDDDEEDYYTEEEESYSEEEGEYTSLDGERNEFETEDDEFFEAEVDEEGIAGEALEEGGEEELEGIGEDEEGDDEAFEDGEEGDGEDDYSDDDEEEDK
ncbi:DNA-directed RNA polymerase subunit delta [Paenibacillus koleovorans]|uniref:DNA-directed RNA polymerase subunit delta n=1 Tax=Paenibacillus koleovorans TaxID=121608 RepID=UPI000FDAD10E|nr:DNA-directed RNA polymerase subunit delta [Paenibacillus koleovorans]